MEHTLVFPARNVKFAMPLTASTYLWLESAVSPKGLEAGESQSVIGGGGWFEVVQTKTRGLVEPLGEASMSFSYFSIMFSKSSPLETKKR